MLTQNWYNCMRFFTSKNVASAKGSVDSGYNLRDTNGNYYDYIIERGERFLNWLLLPAQMYHPSVYCGDDNTPESLSDYKLSVNAKSCTTSALKTDKGAGVSCVYNNKSNTDYTIAEIFCMAALSAGTGSSATDVHSFLFYRKVLETPVTVPAGGSYAFTLRLGE